MSVTTCALHCSDFSLSGLQGSSERIQVCQNADGVRGDGGGTQEEGDVRPRVLPDLGHLRPRHDHRGQPLLGRGPVQDGGRQLPLLRRSLQSDSQHPQSGVLRSQVDGSQGREDQSDGGKDTGTAGSHHLHCCPL